MLATRRDRQYRPRNHDPHGWIWPGAVRTGPKRTVQVWWAAATVTRTDRR